MEKIHEIDIEKLLIVDEVHGIGSQKQMLGLDDIYDYRLGLSATPSRYFDDEGTAVINDFFGGVVFEFDLTRALTEINPDTGEVIKDKDGNEIKIRGKKNVTTYFNEHTDEWKKLYDKVYEKLSQKEDPYIVSFEKMLNVNTKEVFGFDPEELNSEE